MGRSKTHPASSTGDIWVQFAPSSPCTPHLPRSSLQVAGERHPLSFGSRPCVSPFQRASLPGDSAAKSPQPGLTGAGPRQTQRLAAGLMGMAVPPCRAGWEEGDCRAGASAGAGREQRLRGGLANRLGLWRASGRAEITPDGKNPPNSAGKPGKVLARGPCVQGGCTAQHGTVGSALCIQGGCVAWHGGQQQCQAACTARAWHVLHGPSPQDPTVRHSTAQPGTTGDACLRLGWLHHEALPTPGGAPHPKCRGAAGPRSKDAAGRTRHPSGGSQGRGAARGRGCKHPNAEPRHGRYAPGEAGRAAKGVQPRRGTVKRPPPARGVRQQAPSHPPRNTC